MDVSFTCSFPFETVGASCSQKVSKPSSVGPFSLSRLERVREGPRQCGGAARTETRLS